MEKKGTFTMRYFLLLAVIIIAGCSVSRDYRYNEETGKLYLHGKMTCSGAGCKADFEKHKMEGGQVVDLSGLEFRKD